MKRVNQSKLYKFYFNDESQRRREDRIFKSALNYKTEDLKNLTYLSVPILRIQCWIWKNKIIKLIKQQLVKDIMVIEGCKHINPYVCSKLKEAVSKNQETQEIIIQSWIINGIIFW